MLRMQVAHWVKHLLISPWPSTFLSVHLFISSSDDNPPCRSHYSSPSPSSDNHSINTSICAPIQQFICPSIYPPHHSFICLSSTHPSISTHTWLHQFPETTSRLQPSCIKSATHDYNRLYVSLLSRHIKTGGTFGSTSRVIASVTRQWGKKLKDSTQTTVCLWMLCGKVLGTKRWVFQNN